MTDNHMVFFAEIAFIYGGNDSSEEDVFGSEKSSERSSGTVRELILIRFLDKPSCKDKHGDIHTTEIKRKTYILRFKFDFCEITTKIALKNGLNIDLGNILFVYLRDVKLNDPDKKCQD